MTLSCLLTVPFTVAAPGYAVSAVGEESSHVLRTHGSQRSSHRLDEAPLRALAPISLRMCLTLAISALRELFERAAYASLAHRDPARGEKELGPLGVGGPRALSEVF